ncbi:MAG: serine/threonine protein kinase [Planctomycetaceae bacterium]|nr:serine/threonine protein kinase [Planctomycetaceae bacterium]
MSEHKESLDTTRSNQHVDSSTDARDAAILQETEDIDLDTAIKIGVQANAFEGFVPGYVFADSFRLEHQIGRGGMGEAWKAYDFHADRFVVIKLLPKEIRHIKAAVENVKSSFKKIHTLQHAHIRPVYGISPDPVHGLYMVMKYIDGLTLDEYKKFIIKQNGSFKFSEAVQILWCVAQGLDYAHYRKIIHRDIKPQNIMISEEDGVQIIDFGLAEKIRTNLIRFSEVQTNVSGTRPYMAPEQWQGKYQDANTDQYALAVLAYELFCGKLPFYNTDTSVLRMAVLNEAPEPLAGFPDHVNNALLKALSKRREERFENCREFIKVIATKPKKRNETESETETDADTKTKAGTKPETDKSSANLSLNILNENVSKRWRPIHINVFGSTSEPKTSPEDTEKTVKPSMPKWMIPAGIAAAIASAVLLMGLFAYHLTAAPKKQQNNATTAQSPPNNRDANAQSRNRRNEEPGTGIPAKLSNTEKQKIQQKYPELEFDWAGSNVILLDKPTQSGLEQALMQAAKTKENDVIVVKTSKENHRIKRDRGSFQFSCNTQKNGSVAIVALGTEKLILDSGRKARVFEIENQADVTFAGVVFTNGYVIDTPGGGVHVDGNSTARFYHCDFIDNASIPNAKKYWWKGVGGGGLSADGDCTIVLHNVLFEGNRNNQPNAFEEPKKEDTAVCNDSSGGMLIMDKSSLFATNVVLRNNLGGGMFLHNMKEAELQNISLVDNKSLGCGAVHLCGFEDERTYKITNLFASGNRSGKRGGAIRICGKGIYQFNHLTLVDNSAEHGGALSVVGDDEQGFLIAVKEIVLSNSIITGNHAADNCDIQVDYENVGKTHIHNCIINNADKKDTSISENQNNRFLPFADVKLGKLQYLGNGIPVMPLLEGSPAIGAGVITETTPKTDITGRIRKPNRAPDIGAFEWQQ